MHKENVFPENILTLPFPDLASNNQVLAYYDQIDSGNLILLKQEQISLEPYFTKIDSMTYQFKPEVDEHFIKDSDLSDNFKKRLIKLLGISKMPKTILLKNDIRIAGHTLMAGTTITLDRIGFISEAEKSTYLEQGASSISETIKIKFGTRNKTHIYASSFDLVDNSLIDGRTYKAGTNIQRHKNGSVMRGTLAKPATIHGISIPSESSIILGKKGELYELTPGSPVSINGIATDNKVTFHKGQKIKSIYLLEETKLNGLVIPANVGVHFFENGRFKLLNIPFETNFLTDKITLFGFSLEGNSSVKFHQNGEPLSLYSKENTLIEDVLYQSGIIKFHDNKQLEMATLINEGMVKGFHVEKLSVLKFHANGAMARYDRANDGYEISLDNMGAVLSEKRPPMKGPNPDYKYIFK